MRLLDRIINKIFFLLYDLLQPKSKPIEPATPQLVSKRFRQLFKDHGVEETQIPRVFQEITLDDLKSDDSLLKKLTTDFIDEVTKGNPPFLVATKSEVRWHVVASALG